MRSENKFIIPRIPDFKVPKIRISDITQAEEYRRWLKKIEIRKRLTGRTLVIGARGKDGIVIGADRKVISGEGSSSYEDKITVYEIELPKEGKEEGKKGNIIFSATGLTGIWEDFREDFISSLKENVKDGNIKNLKDVKMFAEISLEQLYLHYLPSLGKGFIHFILGGLRELSWGDAILYNLIPVEPEFIPKDTTPPAYGERVKNVIMLGHGKPYARTLARFLLREEFVNSLSIEELAERIYVCIKWVASNGIDDYVGGEPQIFGLKDNDPKVIDLGKTLKKEKIDKKISSLQEALINWKTEE